MTFINRIKSFFAKHPEEEQVLETIEEIIDERVERGDKVLVEPDELGLLKNLFKLKDLRAGEIRIPTIDISGVSIDASFEELKRFVIEDKFTRLPVYDKTLDNIVGVVHVKDILCALLNDEKIVLKDIMTNNLLFVPESSRALDLLRQMQAKKAQMAIIIDEYGGTEGLITLEDLLEEIVGEIEDEHDALDSEECVLHKTGNSLIEADARVYLKDLEEMIGPFLTPKEQEEELDTIGGLVFHLSGKLPKIGDKIQHSSGVMFQVIDADNRHIKKVKITRFKAVREHSRKQAKSDRRAFNVLRQLQKKDRKTKK